MYTVRVCDLRLVHVLLVYDWYRFCIYRQSFSLFILHIIAVCHVECRLQTTDHSKMPSLMLQKDGQNCVTSTLKTVWEKAIVMTIRKKNNHFYLLTPHQFTKTVITDDRDSRWRPCYVEKRQVKRQKIRCVDIPKWLVRGAIKWSNFVELVFFPLISCPSISIIYIL